MNNQRRHQDFSVVIIGAGQAGLSASYYLQQADIDHVVLEKDKALNAWKKKRWDSFCLVTPNWQCRLPNHPYDGNDPHGFMVREEIIEYLTRFEKKVNAPVRENTVVKKVHAIDANRYQIITDKETLTTANIIVATGGYHDPIIPRMAERIPTHILQCHSEQYKSPDQMPEGAVLVVGSGQSGAQIAEDLFIAGRKVYLATGKAPRCARFYRGRDVVKWLDEMKYYDMPVDAHPLREGVRDNTNHYVTGRDGGRDIDLRKFAKDGMKLFGLLTDYRDDQFHFKPNLNENLNHADEVYNNINMRIDKYIAANNIDAPPANTYTPVWQPPCEHEALALPGSDIAAIVWCIGFTTNYDWLDVPVFNGRSYPVHQRGASAAPGIFFLGLPWQYTWGSGRFSGVAQDAKHICDAIEKQHRTDKYALSR